MFSVEGRCAVDDYGANCRSPSAGTRWIVLVTRVIVSRHGGGVVST